MGQKSLTHLGQTMLARQAAGETLTFTSIKIGDGIIAEGTNILLLTGLVNPVKSVDITEILVKNSINTEIKYTFSNEGFETPKAISEIGVYAKIGNESEQLYAYADKSDNIDNVPAFSSDTLVHRISSVIMLVSNASNVKVELDETIVYVTHENLNLRLSQKADLSELQKIKDYLGLEDLQSALGYSYLGEFYLG